MSAYVERVNRTLKAAGDLRYEEFLAAGHAAPGCNGPYGAVDTPVRNTGHWLITYTYLYKLTGDEKYRKISQVFCRYLLAEQAKTASGAIACMSDKGADHLNGMIGQAWTIEALVYAYETYGGEEILECAFKIFRSQSFDPAAGMWRVVELDGRVCDFDKTVNHQLWFCIAGLLLLRCREDAAIRAQVERHLECIRKDYFGIHPNGLIRHYGPMHLSNRTFAKFYVKQHVKHLLKKLHLMSSGKIDSLEQEEGYHLFELYGYAVVATLCPEEPLFHRPDFRKAVAYDKNVAELHSALKLGTSKNNPYAYGYNSPAYEYPLIHQVFSAPLDEAAALELMDTHEALIVNPETGLYDRNNADPETLMARLYEHVRCCERMQ